MSAKKGVERTVKAISGQDKVKIARVDKTIQVTWFCGASRIFSTEQADLALDAMDRLIEFPELWVNVPCNYPGAYAQVIDGKLAAGETPEGRQQECDWQEFRTAFAYVTNAAKKA